MLPRFAMIISVKTLIIGFPKNIIGEEGAFRRKYWLELQNTKMLANSLILSLMV